MAPDLPTCTTAHTSLTRRPSGPTAAHTQHARQRGKGTLRRAEAARGARARARVAGLEGGLGRAEKACREGDIMREGEAE